MKIGEMWQGLAACVPGARNLGNRGVCDVAVAFPEGNVWACEIKNSSRTFNSGLKEHTVRKLESIESIDDKPVTRRLVVCVNDERLVRKPVGSVEFISGAEYFSLFGCTPEVVRFVALALADLKAQLAQT